MRIASKVFSSDLHGTEAVQRDQLVFRITNGCSHAVKATFYELGRKIKTVTIQRYTLESGRPHEKTSVSIHENELPTFLEFLLNIKRLHFPDSGKINVTDEAMREMVLSSQQLYNLAVQDQDALIAISENKITKRDITALAYRKEQLRIFRNLIDNNDYFSNYQTKVGAAKREDAWQHFFESNKWIFGYGLTLISMNALDGRRLEQLVAGAHIGGHGKRPDALMKTRGLVNALCFVEIKDHRTPLLKTEYRRGVWQPSPELVSGIAQVQATVQAALTTIGESLEPTTPKGDPTGERIRQYEPRSFLVVGSLSEFQTEHGINDDKFRSFELYRHNTHRPEVITFDELYERAALIVAGSEESHLS
jgi:hypothetical protein